MIASPLFKKPAAAAGGGGWTRPSDWLTMPTITASEQKIAALFAVGDYSTNHVAFRMSGAYTVDWGDGNTENVAANTTAQHVYNYSDLSASTEFDYSGATGRQAMIVITPQSGQNLTSVSFDYRHSDLVGTSLTPILEIVCSAPNATTLKFGGSNGWLGLMEQCTVLSHNASNLVNLFHSCQALQSVPLFDTSAVTTVAYMFFNCYALQSVPLFDTSSATSTSNMFYGCSSLKEVPLFDTSSVLSMSFMFQSCFSLKEVPLFDTSSVTNFFGMFQSCLSLQSVPLLDMSNGSSHGNTFNGCSALQSIPAIDCSGSTNMSAFASNARSLSRCQATGISKTVTFQNCSLGATELDEIYTNLATVTGQTITVTGNRGVASDNPSIATAKGWTVTG